MRSRAWNFFFLSFSPVVMVVYKRREKKKTTSPSSSRRRKQILGSRGHFTYNPRQRFTSVARSGGAVFGPSQGRVQQTDYIHQNFAISLLCHRQSLDWISKEKQKTISISLWGKSPLKVYYNHFPKCGQASIGPNIHETQIEGTRDIVQVKTKRDGGGINKANDVSQHLSQRP